MKLIDTHPELPQLPEGYFFRIWQEDVPFQGETVKVQIRKRRATKWGSSSKSVQYQDWSLDIQRMKVDGQERGRLVNSREAAVWCGCKAAEELDRAMRNKLGDLEGDHPA